MIDSASQLGVDGAWCIVSRLEIVCGVTLLKRDFCVLSSFGGYDASPRVRCGQQKSAVVLPLYRFQSRSPVLSCHNCM